MQLRLAARRSFGPPTGALFAKPPTPLRAAADQAHGANAGALSPPGGVTIPCRPTVARATVDGRAGSSPQARWDGIASLASCPVEPGLIRPPPAFQRCRSEERRVGKEGVRKGRTRW